MYNPALYACKALSVLLMVAILSVGCYAVHLTHVYGVVTVSFGEVEKVDAIKIPATLQRGNR